MAKSHLSLVKLGQSLCLTIRGPHHSRSHRISLSLSRLEQEGGDDATRERRWHEGERHRSQPRPPLSSASSLAKTIAIVRTVPGRNRRRPLRCRRSQPRLPPSAPSPAATAAAFHAVPSRDRPRRLQPRLPPPRGFDRAA